MDPRDARTAYDRMADVAARIAGVEAGEILGRSKREPLVSVRAACWHVLQESGMSYSQIGRIAGRDHTSISHTVKVFRSGSIRRPCYRGLVFDLRDCIDWDDAGETK